MPRTPVKQHRRTSRKGKPYIVRRHFRTTPTRIQIGKRIRIVNKYNLSAQARTVVRILLEEKKYMTTRQIADKAGFSWQLTDELLIAAHDFGWVSRKEVGSRIYWKAIR